MLTPQTLLNLPNSPENSPLEYFWTSNSNFLPARPIIFIQFPYIYYTILGPGTERNLCIIGFLFLFLFSIQAYFSEGLFFFKGSFVELQFTHHKIHHLKNTILWSQYTNMIVQSLLQSTARTVSLPPKETSYPLAVTPFPLPPSLGNY